MQSRVRKKEKQEKLERNRNRKLKKEKRIEKFKKEKRKLLIALLILIILFLIYSILFEPKLLKINEIPIKTNEISSNFHGIKILHFSDLHYGTSINKSNINKLIDKINSTEPDIIIFTGDLIDSNYNMTKEDIRILTDAFKNINYNLGKYAVLGDHDYNNKDYSNIMYDSDFIVLKNSFDTIYNKDNSPILIYGLDNITYGKPSMENMNNDKINKIQYKILIMHETDYITKLDLDDIDLILAGHNMGGTIKLFGKQIFTKDNSKIYFKDHYKINDTNMYISNGTGTNKVPIRFMNIPSINLYRLIKTES